MRPRFPNPIGGSSSVGLIKMEYTEITEEELKLYNEKMYDQPGFKPNWAKIKTLSQTDASIFAKFYLGITPFHYQDQVLNDNSDRIIVCSSRQIGKTYVVAIKALHHAMFNAGSEVLVFSKSSSQAKKFLRQMKHLMFLGQQHVNKITASASDGYAASNDEPAYVFPEEIDKKKPNNTEEFSLTNGSIIRSLPPTDSSRGYTGNVVIIDEASFVDDEIFDTVIEPTVRFTGGKIILLSTPNGQKGFFHHFFDPDDKRRPDERDETKFTYRRYWWDWRICPNKEIQDMTLNRKADLDPIRFAQEYEAKFTTDADGFFQHIKVKQATDDSLSLHYENKHLEMVCGIDYGVTKSKTVITLSYYDRERDDVILAYQHAFVAGYDNSNLRRDLINLEARFKIVNYVVDDCPQGQDITNWLLKEGRVVTPIYFGKEKVGMFWRFKAALNKRHDDDGPRVRYPLVNELISEMLALQQKDSKRTTGALIEKPQGGSDDRIDSFVLSTYPFLIEEKKTFRGSYLV
jgi:hypothetical protein